MAYGLKSSSCDPLMAPLFNNLIHYDLQKSQNVLSKLYSKVKTDSTLLSLSWLQVVRV